MKNSKKSYILKLIHSEKNDNNLYKNISKSLHKKIKSNCKLEQATQFAEEINISKSLITKYLKHVNIEHWSVLRHTHNEFIDEKKNNTHEVNDKFPTVVDIIDKARKILMIGVSSSLLVNIDFATKLARIGKWTITPTSKYEQVGISRIMQSNDVIIINSISLQHEWMVNIINKASAKIVLITGGNINFDKKNLSIIKLKKMNRIEISPSRTSTTIGRRNIMEIYDNLFLQLIRIPKYKKALEKTSYN